MSNAPGSVFISQRTVYFLPDGSVYVVPLDSGHCNPEVGIDEADAEVLTPTIDVLVCEEELLLEDEVGVALEGLLLEAEVGIALEELLLVEDTAIELDELLCIEEDVKALDELPLADEDVMALDELDSETGPANLRPAFVAPS